MAIGALSAFQGMGLSEPEDVSLVGFDNIALASYDRPALTTVSQPKYTMGEMVVELLIERILGELPQEPRDILLNVELVVRESTGRKPDV